MSEIHELPDARVDVYHRSGKDRYDRDRKGGVTLHDNIRKKGFEIINLTTLEQLSYASNFLCIKDWTIWP